MHILGFYFVWQTYMERQMGHVHRRRRVGGAEMTFEKMTQSKNVTVVLFVFDQKSNQIAHFKVIKYEGFFFLF